MPAKHKTVRVAITGGDQCPPMPDYLSKDLLLDWQSIHRHLHSQGMYMEHADSRLMEAWVSNLSRIREAHRVLQEEGSYPDGKLHPAHGVATTAASVLAKLASSFGISGTTRTILMTANLDASKKEAASTGAWATAAAIPTQTAKAAPTKVSPIRRGAKA